MSVRVVGGRMGHGVPGPSSLVSHSNVDLDVVEKKGPT